MKAGRVKRRHRASRRAVKRRSVIRRRQRIANVTRRKEPTMSDEAEKAWTAWVGNHQDVRATHRLAFDAGVESQQRRIRELEAGRDIEQTMLRNGAELVESLREQLAARDAVIERVRQWGDIPLDQEGGDYAALEDILNAAPESTLAELIREKQAEAWDERSRDTWPFASTPNPYRKGAGQ